MARQSQLIRINFTGGIISPGYLLQLLEIAEAAKAGEVRFGLRQELFLEIAQTQLQKFAAACKTYHISWQPAEDGAPNITSSYPGANIFVADSWLTEGIYKDIFDLFNYQPSLKINICDSQQTFCPFFSGHLNWVSSPHQHYWYLYIRRPGEENTFCWPALIYTNSIAALSRELETRLAGETPEAIAQQPPEYISRPLDQPLELPAFHLPYYEGFNRQGNQYWLGIYRRNETFAVDFLKDICTVCLETGIGQLYATPWKSVIIKNIEPAHRKLWDYVLGKYNINVRHAANELNWQVADNCEDSLILKRHIIRHFDTADVRTYGLCFSIRVKEAGGQFGAILIRRQENRYQSRLKYMQRYDILYKADFNPNAAGLTVYRNNVLKEHLGPYIVSLCKHFYEIGSEQPVLQQYARQQAPPVVRVDEKPLHQCPGCFTVYDEAAGDPFREISPGTAFAALPDSFSCYICGTGKEDFEEIAAASLRHPAV
ncbi:rubredoxin [Chitinophaga lutea]|uniref:Rubredoxin n=1 Tax=Chitinophaga lutea TaxID=2488634 RepID=A0A3N4Q024_9BACT|nr:rubredoxin [Chitinophaga lutea]RPE09300.1 rubredoxin [Chitinophaga lutea]